LRQEIAAITANTELMPQVHLMWLEAPYIASQAQPGQFVMAHCGEDTLLCRPFSIHQLDGKRLALLFNVVGRGTQWLSQRQAGDSLDLLGPLGNGYTVYPDAKNLLLVAGGIGIAPLVFLAQKALKGGCSITLLLGAQTATELYPKDLLLPEVKLITATEDGSAGKRGVVTDLLPNFISRADQIFACGPTSMYQTIATQKLLKKKPVQISLEVRMGCGLGVCYGCTVKTKNGLKQVCKDGPVFDLNDILWEELKD
jgi:dihydroorotate dehydrogenase electron transfer subunit